MKIVSDAKFYEDDDTRQWDRECVGVENTFDQVIKEGLAEEVTFELTSE